MSLRYAQGALILVVLFLLPGCSSAPRVASSAFHPTYSSSRDGILQYRLPVGWFDATADSGALDHVVWLLRNDYGATIAVDELHLNAAARRQLSRGGLMQLAQMVMGLTTGDHGAMLLEPPEQFAVNGRTVCRFHMVTSARDTMRVTLFDTGGKVYSVTSLLSGKDGGWDGMFSTLHDGFVGALRW